MGNSDQDFDLRTILIAPQYDPIDTARVCALSASDPEVGFQPDTDLRADDQMIRNLNDCRTSLRQGQLPRVDICSFQSQGIIVRAAYF